MLLQLVVQRFAVAYEGLDAELFKLESDELCHVDGIYETCLLIREKIRVYVIACLVILAVECDTLTFLCSGGSKNEELTTFLETFEKIFEQDKPKVCATGDGKVVVVVVG